MASLAPVNSADRLAARVSIEGSRAFADDFRDKVCEAVPEFIAYAKANPGKLVMASVGRDEETFAL